MRNVIWGIVLCSGAVGLAGSIAGAPQPPAAQAPAPGAAGRGAPQAGPQNLKVLPKTWTGQQVRALMQTFAESLGVQCNYCHAADPSAPPPAAGRGPTLDYALDTKDEKEFARRMMRMVMALNAESFKGLGDQSVAEKVTCFTCHAGAETPLRAPTAGWARGGFSLLPAGPPLPARGTPPAAVGRGAN